MLYRLSYVPPKFDQKSQNAVQMGSDNDLHLIDGAQHKQTDLLGQY